VLSSCLLGFMIGPKEVQAPRNPVLASHVQSGVFMSYQRKFADSAPWMATTRTV